MKNDRTQAIIDAFYKQHGPCCAGCDWWRWQNSVAGECIKTVPVSGSERVAMLGVSGSSLPLGAGHIMTPRDHFCGEFSDAAPSTAQPSLVCKSCGADRLKEDCKGNRQECDIRGTAQKDGGME